MKKVIPYEIEEGELIFIEVEDENLSGGYQRVSRGGDEDLPAGKFQNALERVKPAANMVVKVFKEISDPDEIALEFGLKFGSKAGAFLASVDSEATFKVAVKWKNDKKPDSSKPSDKTGQPAAS